MQNDDQPRTSKEHHSDPSAAPPNQQQQPGDLLSLYNALLDEHPLATKAVSSAVISGVGGIIGSKLTTNRVNWKAAIAFALHGGLVNGPVGHYWFKWLDEKGPKSTTSSMLLDQLVVQPPLCFLMFVLLDAFQAALAEIPRSVPRTRKMIGGVIVDSWKFWPLAVFLTMRYLKQKHHTLSLNFASLFWTVYLSSGKKNKQ
jgi:hypothetical protein